MAAVPNFDGLMWAQSYQNQHSMVPDKKNVVHSRSMRLSVRPSSDQVNDIQLALQGQSVKQ